eukprot:7363205-Pyramimonas_sp.AAC.1
MGGKLRQFNHLAKPKRPGRQSRTMSWCAPHHLHAKVASHHPQRARRQTLRHIHYIDSLRTWVH